MALLARILWISVDVLMKGNLESKGEDRVKDARATVESTWGKGRYKISGQCQTNVGRQQHRSNFLLGRSLWRQLCK